ncbi:uncharacterized protein LOC129025631 [Pongo pygmaeus]|uniref:uncharacterized protein LOC129025631 n=1 Tax=Pongo pygmaeus TaxID=9600 RepID=UPI0023E202A2|nr:uncharacterized protein LOC129025631 [Pongo pygmaeus]
MHLQPAVAPKLRAPSVCRQQSPGNSHARPHSPHLRSRARCPCGCGEARRSALQQQHRGGNRPSALCPVAAEGPWLEVSSSGRGGAGQGQGLAASQVRGTSYPEAAHAMLPNWAPSYRRRATPKLAGAPSLADPDLDVAVAAAKPGGLPGGGCTGARTDPRPYPLWPRTALAAALISLLRRRGAGFTARRALRREAMRACDSGMSDASPGEPASQWRLFLCVILRGTTKLFSTASA